MLQWSKDLHATTDCSNLYRPAIALEMARFLSQPCQYSTKQQNCGVFAIAYAYHFAIGDNMENLSLHEDDMRPYLHDAVLPKH